MQFDSASLMIGIAIVVGGVVGWLVRSEVQRRQNRRYAKAMAKAVFARKGRQPGVRPVQTEPDRVGQKTRESVANNTRARQGNVRFRGRGLRR